MKYLYSGLLAATGRDSAMPCSLRNLRSERPILINSERGSTGVSSILRQSAWRCMPSYPAGHTWYATRLARGPNRALDGPRSHAPNSRQILGHLFNLACQIHRLCGRSAAELPPRNVRRQI